MEPENQAPTETAEDLAAEKEYGTVAAEDKVRESVIAEYGFDPEDEKDKERITKAVARELGQRKLLSTAIGQKVKYRELVPKKPITETAPKAGETAETVQDILDKRDLEDMEYSDEIKASIKKVAKTEGITVRQAVKDPYIVAKIEAWKKEKGIDEASLSRRDNTSGGGKGASEVDLTPPDVDMTTEKGRKEYDEWVKKMQDAGH